MKSNKKKKKNIKFTKKLNKMKKRSNKWRTIFNRNCCMLKPKKLKWRQENKKLRNKFNKRRKKLKRFK